MITDLWPKIEPKTSEYKAEVIPIWPYYFISYCPKINQSTDMFLSVTQFPALVALVIVSGIQTCSTSSVPVHNDGFQEYI
jgi:hypothetical protein